MPVLFKAFDVGCTVIGTDERFIIYRNSSQTCSWCGTRLLQTPYVQMRSKYQTCGACEKTFHRDIMAAENMISAYGIDTTKDGRNGRT